MITATGIAVLLCSSLIVFGVGAIAAVVIAFRKEN